MRGLRRHSRSVLVIGVSCTLLSIPAFLGLTAAAGVRLGGDGVVTGFGVLNGDVNGDGSRDISDPIALLNWLFGGGPEPVPCGGEPERSLDPMNDLAGYLDPLAAILYVQPGHEAPVLQALGAQPMGRDQYVMQARTSDGNFMSFAFSVRSADTPALFLQDPELIINTPEYKVYKNAKCKLGPKPSPVGCGPYIDGEHATLEYLPLSKCEAGSSYCVEAWSVWWIRRVYRDNECRQLKRIDTGNEFICVP
ncbi:MAG: hypothetical protein HY721_34945 [Planctomycetes bacterium]|nr:hypothetical protein [Planctomycetota bacterium]